ncbi:MAG TPA: A/G-specific adenine glycosylase [Gemmatimonadales bacterium]|nr:A/G-specific adenine glycosylase [Gemmatimonadales bacterium]
MARTSTPRVAKPETGPAFTRRLLAWWRRAARDLPWRHTRDPYRVLVSEVMLQQTQVSRVAEYYPRFLERFPDLGSLAAAPARAVREAWDGLGYYARARNLHRLAKGVARRHHATLPETPEELVKLPGIGPYTAGAVATFAYEKPVPAVDTNVRRVIQRVFFGSGEWGVVRSVAGRRQSARRKVPLPTPHSRQIWELARALVPKNGKRAWKFNQAIMELGALICVARKPKCPECPVRPTCKTGNAKASSLCISPL